MAITTLLFDLDDTLIPETASDQQALDATCAFAASEYNLNQAKLMQAARYQIHTYWNTNPQYQYCRQIGIGPFETLWGDFSGDDVHLQQLRGWATGYQSRIWKNILADQQVTDVEVIERLRERFRLERAAAHRIYPQTRAVLDELKSKYRLALLTNGAPDVQRAKIAGAGLAADFEKVFISGEVGFGKPDARFFKHAIEQLGIEPREAVMIGNNLANDISGARRAGIPQIWVNYTGTYDPTEPRPDFEVRQLVELPPMVQIVSLRQDMPLHGSI